MKSGNMPGSVINRAKISFDGVETSGLADITLPEFKEKEVEYVKPGGSIGKQPLTGVFEAMEMEIKFSRYEKALFALMDRTKDPAFTAFFAVEGDKTEAAQFKMYVEGKYLRAKLADPKSGEKMEHSIFISVDMINIDYAGDNVLSIDTDNNIYVVNGVDQLKHIKKALG